MEWMHVHFIGEPVAVRFKQEPVLEKKPHCPDNFIWRGETFKIVRMVGEWQDYQRRGKMGRNMRPEHAERARRTGSWGVGRFYFRVEVEGGRVFDLYYDRSPKGADERKGVWVLKGEIKSISVRILAKGR